MSVVYLAWIRFNDIAATIFSFKSDKNWQVDLTAPRSLILVNYKTRINKFLTKQIHFANITYTFPQISRMQEIYEVIQGQILFF